ncbi:hypothetical protein AK812_SmicGene31624 [Symbiodinium microadriaticum]|uniref:Uncharacterized protein n=1 Tax=Symbiodinium microadriaticum TaxID=2951 RepID=A0A1Q9CW78_SYMMI|nr:hypothetical protein AK812_SmicGene31624 [Symbiodinium microadriaticum]
MPCTRTSTVLAAAAAMIMGGLQPIAVAELPGAPNPRQLLLLPDASLANLPLETMPSLLRLFGDRGAECILRDHSLHMMAKRVRDSADVAADSAPLKVALQTLPRTSLLDKA